MQKIAFIINPKSGLGKHRVVERMIAKYLDHTKYQYQVLYVGESKSILDLAKDAVDDNCQVVVAVGGDGSVNAVAKILVGTSVTLGIIPVGSGNGLANFLKIPLRIREAIQVLNLQKSMKMDVIKANDEVVVSIAGVGFDALVAYKMKRAKLRGITAYIRFTIKEYIWYLPKKYILEFDDKVIKTKALFVSFANTNQFGYKKSFIPGAKIDDGLLNICIVKKPPFYLISWVGYLLFFHQRMNNEFISYHTASKVKIKQKKYRYMNIDGEAVLMPPEIILEVIPNSINVLIP